MLRSLLLKISIRSIVILELAVLSTSLLPVAGQGSPAERDSQELCNQANTCLLDSSRAEEAASKFSRATQIDHKNVNAYYGLGHAYKILKRRNESLAAFQQAVKLNPNLLFAWIEIAELYYQSGDTKTAESICTWLEKNLPGGQFAVHELRDRLPASDPGKGQQSIPSAGPNSNKGQQSISSALPYSSRTHDETLEEQKQRLKKAIQANVDNRELYIQLAWVCTKLGDINGAGLARQQFAQRFPNDPRSKDENILGEYFQEETAKVKATDESGQVTGLAEYLWGAGEMPLQVYIDTTMKERGSIKQQDVYVALVKKAFAEWSQASRGTISFEFTGSPDSANIICDRVGEMSGLSHVPFAGLSQSGGVNSRRNYIHLVYSLNENAFYGVCLHEIGHALGLSHSNDPNDIMYISSLAEHLSARDKARLLKLYAP